MTPSLELPPELLTRDGRPRRVGVEIEFGAVEPARAAALVRDLYGGRVRKQDRHRFEIPDTRFGLFVVELDVRYARQDTWADKGALLDELKEQVAATVGDVTRFWMPYEVVAPPVELAALPEIDRLVGALRAERAEGTRSSLLYGFGLQLNPEVASTEVGYLLRHLQAYLVLSPWLRAEIDIDPTRRVLPFTDPFPDAYVRQVLAPDYRPDLPRLIDDYLAANATRNRELDLLPLFAHLAPERVRAAISDPHVKARPTFHYRLPNSLVDEPGWGGAVEEWNRWVEVERLAAAPERLARARAAFLERRTQDDWVERARRWLTS